MKHNTQHNNRFSFRPWLVPLWAAIFSGLLLAQTQSVIGEGMAMSRDGALTAAKRDAVEKGVGVVVASETLVKNFQVADDRILSKANGFVKTYEELSAIQGPDGLWTVQITAEVTDILDEVVKDQLAMELLLAWVRHPRFMILLDEQNIDDRNSTVAATEIGRLLAEKGFDIISPSQIRALQQQDANLANIEGNARQAASLGSQLGAEYVILGEASSKAVTHPLLGTRLSGQANITARVIRADNAQILAQETFHGKSTHIDASTAGVGALKDAAENLTAYLLAETVKRWSLEQSNARLLTLKISGLTYQGRRTVTDFLANQVQGVQSVDQRSFLNGVVTLAVMFGGPNEDLGMQLDGRDLGGVLLQIVGETPNGFDLMAQVK